MKWLFSIFFSLQLYSQEITFSFYADAKYLYDMNNPVLGKIYYDENDKKIGLLFPDTCTKIIVQPGAQIQMELFWNIDKQNRTQKEFWVLQTTKNPDRIKYEINISSFLNLSSQYVCYLLHHNPAYLGQYNEITLTSCVDIDGITRAAFYRPLTSLAAPPPQHPTSNTNTTGKRHIIEPSQRILNVFTPFLEDYFNPPHAPGNDPGLRFLSRIASDLFVEKAREEPTTLTLPNKSPNSPH